MPGLDVCLVPSLPTSRGTAAPVTRVVDAVVTHRTGAALLRHAA